MVMVKKMPYNLKVDPQGRLVLPIEMRRILGVTRGGSIRLERRNNRIFFEAGGEELDRDVKRWKDRLEAMRVEAAGFEAGESKWISEDWAKRKLGIPV